MGLTLAALAWARRAPPLTLAEIGIRRPGAVAGALLGLGLGAGAALLGVLFLRFPPLFGAPITYAPVAAVSAGDLLARVFVTMPLDTVVPEETAFRGVLLGLLIRRFAPVPAVLLASVPYTLWHAWITTATVLQTNLVTAPPFVVVGLVGAFAAIFLGGIAFGALRILTGHLATPLAAHWAFNATLLLGLRVVSAA